MHLALALEHFRLFLFCPLIEAIIFVCEAFSSKGKELFTEIQKTT